MTIRWYPGHMGKAKEQIADLIKKTDVIIEVLDARLPDASSNHLFAELRRNKPCIKVLNKNDLADPAITRAWVRHFQQQAGVRPLPLSAKQHRETSQLLKLCRTLAPHRGRPGLPVRAMVVGIPNVGKSTLINTLAGRNVAKSGDRPAVTVTPQLIDLKNGIVLSDTPGLLWPDMEDQTGAYRLAASGAIGDSALDYANVGLFAAAYLMEHYPDRLVERYVPDGLPGSPAELLEASGRRLGCLAGGGVVDLNRAAEAFLREMRAGKLGRISLEEPPKGETVPVCDPPSPTEIRQPKEPLP